MKILIESGTYDMLNLGDVAMLQIGVERLQQALPNAELRLITKTPELLPVYCPGVLPVSEPLFEGRKRWLEPFNLLGPWRRLFPRHAALHEAGLRTRFPQWAVRRISRRMEERNIDAGPVRYFFDAVANADVVAVTGGGFMTDAFLDYNRWLAETAALAAGLGKPVGFFGQGLGPLEDTALRARAAEAYGAAAIVGIRESDGTLEFLRSCGVSESRIRITGDDAIELARRESPLTIGAALGVNLRTAMYSNLGPEHTAVIKRCVHTFARDVAAPLVPLVISRYEGTDLDTIDELFSDDAGARENARAQDMPRKVIQETGRCRLVVTGSYHAGVFALAQGIPMIGLARSRYYIGKFAGLAKPFSAASTVLLMDDPEFETKLMQAMKTLWANAETTRPALLEAADAQIACSRRAWSEFCSMLEPNRTAP